ncbi:MAG: hypothetical protein V4696_00740 [Pseudomonadota bacterium]
MGLFSVVGSLIGGGKAKKASKKAAKAQIAALEKAIEEQRRQYDVTRADFAPYRETGAVALGGLGDLTGLNGNVEQAGAIDQLKASPFYQRLFATGEEAVLQNASATGGIRGGNTQRGLADFGADTLMKTIQQQLASLGGLAGMGMGATGQGAQLGAGTANAIGGFLQGQGNAKATDYLTRGGISQQNWNNIGSFADQAAAALMPGGGGFGSLIKGGF